jgi:hypothetical protein
MCLPVVMTINAADMPSGQFGINSSLPLGNKPLLSAVDDEICSVMPG